MPLYLTTTMPLHLCLNKFAQPKLFFIGILQVIIYYGETGSGKSRTASELCSGQSVYYKPQGDWWDGYRGQDNVIIDDFYGWMRYDEILRICDRYPHQVPIKGGFKEFVAKRIFFTSNEPIENWWKGNWYTEEKRKPFIRRIDIYENFQIIDGTTVRTDMLIENNIQEFLQ